MKRIKSLNGALLVGSITVYILGYVYWNTYCIAGSCSYDFRNETLRPISIGSVYLIGFFFVFIFLPANYFKNWIKYIFSWGFPLAVYMTYITTGSSSIPSYGKVDVVRFWGVFFAVVMITFISVNLFLDWKKGRK